MDEYIKRKDVKKAILDACGYDCRCMAETECNGMCDIHAGSVWGAVDNIPAADVRENVHGKWIPYNALVSDTLCCSECGFNVLPEEAEVYNYCPHCGADMRGERNGKNR